MLKARNKYWRLAASVLLCGVVAMMPRTAVAEEAQGYPVETVKWEQVPTESRAALERLFANLVLVPARDTMPAFYMSRYELTQDVWRAVTGDSTRWDDFVGDSIPAHALSWQEARQFVSRLNELTGKLFRLPTVEEWQHAARGGESYAYAGSDTLSSVGWYKGNCDFALHPAGQKRANAYGLYDMSGNVPEWCTPADGATLMPLMGGGYWMEQAECAVSYADSLSADVQTGGLRLVLDVIRTAEAKALVVATTDGVQTYALAEQPRITIEKPYLYVDAGGSQDSYELAKVVNMQYANASAAARAKAEAAEQEEPEGRANAVYTYRNDGDFNAFLNIDVDSIVYSRVGLDNLEYDNHVVQEVWTPDSVFRIPLAAVDSIGFHQPKPVLRSELVFMNEYHALHANAVNDLTIEFDRFISPDSIPAVGQVLVSKYEGEPFEDGFVGKVTEVKPVVNGTQVVCKEAGLSDIFKQLMIVGKAVTNTDSVSLARRVGPNRIWEQEDEQGLTKIELPFEDGFPSLSFCDFFSLKSTDPDIYCSYYVYLNEFYYVMSADVYIDHKKLTLDVDFNTSNLGKIDKAYKEVVDILKSLSEDSSDKDEEKKEKSLLEKEWEVKLPIPLVETGLFNLTLEVAPLIKAKGDLSLDAQFTTTGRQHVGFKATGSHITTDILYPYWATKNFEKSASFEMDPFSSSKVNVRVKGSVTLGLSANLVASLIHKKVLHASVGVEYGRKLSGTFDYCLFDSENPNMNIYDRIKDTKVGLEDYFKLNGSIGVTPVSFLSLNGEWTLWKKDWGTYYALPHFTMPDFPKAGKFSYGGLQPKSVYTTPSKDIMFPCKLGMRVRDALGNTIKEITDDLEYYNELDWRNHFMGIDVSDLPTGAIYKFYPTYCLIGSTFFDAGPAMELAIPSPMMLSVESLIMRVGETDTIEIINGWQEYDVSLNVGVITSLPSHNPRKIVVKALEPGSATVVVEDRRDGKTIEVPITVLGDELQPIPENTYAMKYWFDDQKELAGELSSISAVMDLDVSGLSDGLHALHVAVCEDMEYLGHYESTPRTVYFFKEGQKTDIVYDYYVDGKKLTDSHTKAANLLTTYLPMFAVDEGVHSLTTVATLAGTKQTAVHNDFFVRANNSNEESTVRLQVSIDDAPPTTLQRTLVNGELDLDLDVSGLSQGLHKLNYRLTGSKNGVNTPPRTAFFLVDSKLTGYEYQLNGDASTLVSTAIDKAESRAEMTIDLPLQSMPVRSSKFHFAVENGVPCVYAVNDLSMRVFDERGFYADSTAEYIDVNAREEVKNVTALQQGVPAAVAVPAENTIRWFSLDAYRGDGIRLEASQPCALQLFAPDGEEIYHASGEAAMVVDGTNGRLSGTYYVAVHDAPEAAEGSDITVTWHPGASILTEPVVITPGDNTVYEGQDITLSTETPDATIWYTVDASRPSLESTRTHKYESPLTISEETIVRTFATCEDMLASDETASRIGIAKIDQNWQLKKGWNWVSVNNATGDAIDVMTFLQPFESSAQRVLGQTEELVKDPVYGFIGNLSELNPQEGYRIQMAADASRSWQDKATKPSTRPLHLYKGWNWIGFLPVAPMTPAQAFADFTPSENDCVTGQNGFATFADGQWSGSLTLMEPGLAYHYKSGQTAQMAYSDDIPDVAASRVKTPADVTPVPEAWTYDVHAYPDVTAVIARLEPGGALPAGGNYVVGAFCGNECRGVGQLVDGVLFVTVHTAVADAELISFRAVDMADGQEIVLDEHVLSDGQVHGTPSQPLLLHATGGATTSAPASLAQLGRTFDVYSLTGVLLRRQVTSLRGLKPGVYVINGRTVKL